MKRKFLLFTKTVAFLLILLFCFMAVALVVERKSSYIKNEMYIQEAEKEHVDVFFLGSSHVINGINPVQLYDEQGITAYNLGGYGSVLLSSYWQFRLALERRIPDLVVIDAYMLENDVRYVDDPNANVNSDELHLNIDRFPLTRTKILAINDMFQDDAKKYPFLFDYIIYHDRWKELDSDDFNRLTGNADINRFMGAEMKYVMHSDGFTYTDYGAGTLDRETVGTTYLRRIIDDCQIRGIKVAIVTVPFLAMAENQAAAHTASQIASEYGIPCLNMLEIPDVVDYGLDFMDAGHLNILGATKVTRYIGNWLKENFDLADHRGDAEYATWQKCADEFYDSQKSALTGNADIHTQLIMMKLDGDSTSFAFSIRGGSVAYADDVLMRQLKSFGAGEKLDEAIASKSSYFLISDHGNITEFAGDDEEKVIETSDGVITYEGVSDLYRIMNIGDDKETNYLYSDEFAYSDVQIIFFEEGEVSSHQYYTGESFDYSYEER
ncbi:hypothetical protein SAMN02910275_00912 [Butyrivibrio sp. INlla18]|uniref:hypothetical protein n=1 Tax=Butyrivibrio sp. INlla18 TaxID=1520806 RepID=UPI00088022E8|nr:hypothetical protein [Butyrivibrio sp. INlla18]SDA50957.1 hypothetical protein SAMN02910275_00912 [Butyrivibrio sp. INlla18]